MIRKIVDLTKIFFVDYFQNLAIVDKKTNKLNKKSLFTWLIIIIVVALSYASYQIIDMLREFQQQQIFLNAYFLVLSIITAFQTILICTNVFYFSKDLEYVLPLPIKPVELLIAKFNAVLGVLYTFEAIIGIAPLIIYGAMCSKFAYFVYMIPILLLFPIFISLVICILMLFVMQLSKFIRNKDIFQIVVVLILTSILTIGEAKVINEVFSDPNTSNYGQFETGETLTDEQITEELKNGILGFNTKLTEVNKTFLIVNPCVNILNNPVVYSILDLVKIICIEAITFSIFIGVGKITYLKNLLKNIERVSINKKIKTHNVKNEYIAKKIGHAYIAKEFKMLIKNPTFFMQCVFPMFMLLIVFVVLANTLWPVILDTIKLEEMQGIVSNLTFGIEFEVIILGIIQLLFTLSNISITAISREGKNAMFMKYIPVSLYKQFIYKNVPQILINTLVVLTVIITVHFLVPTIALGHLAITFVIAMLMNFINSYLMVIVDLKKPNLNWDSEYIVMKQNNNKLFQYVFTIAVILILSYMSKVMININFNIALIAMIIIFTVILIIIDKYVKINIGKLFKNVN